MGNVGITGLGGRVWIDGFVLCFGTVGIAVDSRLGLIKMTSHSNLNQKIALILLVIMPLLYIGSLWPAFFLTVLLVMSFFISDIPLVYLAIAVYFLSILLAVPRAIQLYWHQNYQSTIITILIPLLSAFLFGLAFYFFVIQYEG